MTKPIKYIYILSQRYSGSTLLSFLLGTHPDISTIGERRKFWVNSVQQTDRKGNVCSCGKPFPDCEHWSAIKYKVASRLDLSSYSANPTEFKIFENKYANRLAFELAKPSLLSPNKSGKVPFGNTIKKQLEFNQVLVEETLKLDGKSTFLDSSKSIDQIAFLARIKAFDLHVIWLTRDPRAQVNSAMKYNAWTAAEATGHWKTEMVKNAQYLSALGINSTTLTYEALCRNPELEMTRLLDFAGLDSDRFSLNFRQQTQHIMGNASMRLGKEDKIQERTEWKSELSAQQINTIESLTKDYRKYFSG